MKVHIALLTVTDTRTFDNDKSGAILVDKIKEANHTLLDRKICKDNKDEIVPLIRQINDELEEVAQFLIEGDSESVFKTFATAKSARQRFLDQCDE